jgi:uncharacterized membrane protein YidH (DUF202 family)
MVIQDKLILALLSGYGICTMIYGLLFMCNVIWFTFKHVYPINYKFVLYYHMALVGMACIIPFIVIFLGVFGN